MNSTLNSIQPKRIFAAANKKGELELLIYDSIGESWWGGGGVTADAVKRELNAAGAIKKIVMRINSPGGDVFEAAAIYSLLSQHKAPVDCYVDGLAASAAFTIAMSADKIHVSQAAMMMCHNAAGMCMGEASDMKKMAGTLEKISGVMRDIYSKRSGMPADEVQKLMDEETWMTAKEAYELGFADQLLVLDKDQAKGAEALAESYDLSKFSKKAARKADAAPADGGWESRLESLRREMQLQQFAEFAVSPRPHDADGDWESRLESRRRQMQLT